MFYQFLSIFDRRQPGDDLFHELNASSVPVTSVDCHEEYPSRFNIDTTSQLLGTVKSYRRQVFISTGQSDWDREVTDTPGSLAALLLSVQDIPSVRTSPRPSDKTVQTLASGLLTPTDSCKISILNASHHSVSNNDANETVLVFPDYKLVTDVHRTIDSARELWHSVLNPTIGRIGVLQFKSAFKSWVLPYACVILLCSHRKRDKRCGIAAPKLEQAFVHYLGLHGWHVDTDIDPAICHDTALEDVGQDLERQQNDTLRESLKSERALILFTSHIGGHKFAGNCIIYTPQGSCIWYGRVTPHEVESIVTSTIIGGVVLPSLLRGGLNISRPGCKTLHDW
ncbi:hypothetical protein APHAL10511_002164 [Amanita phalloides]|nr:hypothetical protein APHAL10511_002164 [Amanita phalloides]